MELVMRINGLLRRIPVWPGYLLGFLPAAWLLWLGINDRLGPNPVKALEHGLGEIALQLLILSLLISPIMQLTRINLCRFRRMIGLMAFYYVLLHFAVYVFLDLQLNWVQLAKDLTKRPYIIIGVAAMLLLVPVALTSNDLSLRKLGTEGWRRIHKLVFPAAILAAGHYVWLVKSWPAEPLIYAAIVLALVLWRPLYREFRTTRRPPATAAQVRDASG